MEQKPLLPPPAQAAAEAESGISMRQKIIIGVVALVLLAAFILSIVYLMNPSSPTSTIRDIFIIFMALESLVIGVVLVILCIQLAILINLLQNEIKPILNSTNETVSTLRGTVTFLSDNLAEPVIKLNEYMAGLKKFIDLVRPSKW
ncbi:MAG TPA: hypothetical protein PKW33_01410 [Anaerolineaceae bacterium]|nr:hypothetical protein [Anaerolineaceae bacterium]HPN50215.1 hypothetical protein [Anaerolineaceae bacterium]